MMLDWDTVTPFQRKVFEAVQQIPHGRVATYQAVGLAIGCRSPRAIGQALKRNPFAPVIPCHRVIASQARLGGFFGTMEGPKIREKQALLEAEGVLFHEGKLVDDARLFTFP